MDPVLRSYNVLLNTTEAHFNNSMRYFVCIILYLLFSPNFWDLVSCNKVDTILF